MKAHIVAAVLLLAAYTSYAQVAGYRFTHESGGFLSIDYYNDAVVTSHVPDDDAVSPSKVPLPMPFHFGGRLMDSVGLSSNGFAWFGPADGSGVPVIWPISQSSNTDVTGIVSAMGIDLYPRAGTSIRSAITGRAPFRLFIMEWLNAARVTANGGAQPGDTFDFQIRLYETTNRVEINYGRMVFDPGRQNVGQVGLRGRTDADFRNCVGTWPKTTAGQLATDRITLSNANAPRFGQMLVWEPDLTTGIVRGHQEGISIYPVPARDILHIRDPQGEFSAGVYSIYSGTGQQLLSGSLAPGGIATSMLPPGTYLLSLDAGSRSLRLPFVRTN